MDIDIWPTPFTNTFPIHREPMAVGERRDFRVAWVFAPDLTVRPQPQAYTRLADQLYLFENLNGSGLPLRNAAKPVWAMHANSLLQTAVSAIGQFPKFKNQNSPAQSRHSMPLCQPVDGLPVKTASRQSPWSTSGVGKRPSTPRLILLLV